MMTTLTSLNIVVVVIYVVVVGVVALVAVAIKQEVVGVAFVADGDAGVHSPSRCSDSIVMLSIYFKKFHITIQ